MSVKDQLVAALKEYGEAAGAAGNTYVQLQLGKLTSIVEHNKEKKTCGKVYTAPGFVDGLLTAIGAVVQAPVIALHSPQPCCVYKTAATVEIHAHPGFTSAVSRVLPDGATRSFTAPLTWNITASGEGGKYTGVEAPNTWYYLYLVPKQADDTKLDVISGTDPPDTGPGVGYPIFEYLGAVHNDASGNLRKFYQTGKRFTYANRLNVLTSAGVFDVSPTPLPMANFVPDTASEAFLQAAVGGPLAAEATLLLWIDGEQAGGFDYKAVLRAATLGGHSVCLEGALPTPTSPKQLYYLRKQISGTFDQCELDVLGWVDDSLF